MPDPATVARTVARFLAAAGVDRLYGLTGSHIKPLWEEATKAGIRVVDVRHEVAAVHMAHAEADLTGRLAVATVNPRAGRSTSLVFALFAFIVYYNLMTLGTSWVGAGRLGLGSFTFSSQSSPSPTRARYLVSPVSS